jgi:preprotein translocase subunit SecE
MTTEVQASGLDTAKLAAAVLLLVGGVVAFYMLSDQHLWIRVLTVLALAGIAVLMASQTKIGRSIISFFGETRTEVRKVVWPTRQETVQTTFAVMFVVVVMGLLLWGLDAILFGAIRLLTGQGG